LIFDCIKLIKPTGGTLAFAESVAPHDEIVACTKKGNLVTGIHVLCTAAYLVLQFHQYFSDVTLPTHHLRQERD
jgi:hypothetical protein